VGHDDGQEEGRYEDSGDRHRDAGAALAASQPVPDAEAGHDERDLFLGQYCESEKGQRREQPAFVQVPEPVEEQRTGEGHGVEVVEREPLHRGVEQEDEGKERCGAFGAQVLASEPEDRKRPEGDRGGLDDQEHRRARPDPPERDEGGK
jgi:hypothetical protein